MRKFILFLILLLPLKNYAVTFFKGTYNEALTKCKADKKLLFLDFTAPWCGPCHKMEREVLNDVEVSAFMDKNFISIKIDIDDPGSYYYKDKFNVNGIPDYTIVNYDEETWGKHTSECSTKELMTFFENTLSGKNTVRDAQKIAEIELAYKEKPDANNTSAYLNVLINKKNELELAAKLLEVADANNLFSYGFLYRSAKMLIVKYGSTKDTANLERIMELVDAKMETPGQVMHSKLLNYEFWIAAGDLVKAKESLNIYLGMETPRKNYEAAYTPLSMIKAFAYRFGEYNWGIIALNNLKENYPDAFRNKTRMPLSGHYYHLALMNYLSGNCAGTKSAIELYDQFKGTESTVRSSYKTEDKVWLSRMRACDDTSKKTN